MLNRYLIKKIARFITLAILLTACNGGSSTYTPTFSLTPRTAKALRTLPDGTAMSDSLLIFASKIQGTWTTTDCSKQEQATYYGKVQLTVSGWNVVLTNTYFNDSLCAKNEIGKLVRTALITDLAKSSSTFYKLLISVERTDMTPLTSSVAADWNTRSACGINEWNQGIAQNLEASYLCQYGPTVMDSIGSGTGHFSMNLEPDFTSKPNTISSQGKILIRQ